MSCPPDGTGDVPLSEQRVLGDEMGFTTPQVGCGAEHNRVAGIEMEEGLFEERTQTHQNSCELLKGGSRVIGL